MINDILEIYKYLAEKHPESATQILYGVNLVEQYLKKSVTYLKEDMKKEIDDGDYKSISGFYDLIRKLEREYDDTLQKMAQFSKEKQPVKQPESMPGEQQVSKEAQLGDDGKWVSINSNLTSTQIIGLKLGDHEYQVATMTDVYLKVFECFYAIDSDKFRKMLVEPFIARYTPARLTVYPVSEKSQKMQNAAIYVWKNLSNRDKQQTILDVLKYYGYSESFVKVAINPDYIPKERSHSDKHNEKPAETDKIGSYIRAKMEALSDSGFMFSDDMLHALTSKELTKKLIGVNYAMLVSEQDYHSEKVNPKRYWKNPMRFNGNIYYVTSQWYDYQREGFDKWFKSLKTTIKI